MVYGSLVICRMKTGIAENLISMGQKFGAIFWHPLA